MRRLRGGCRILYQQGRRSQALPWASSSSAKPSTLGKFVFPSTHPPPGSEESMLPRISVNMYFGGEVGADAA